MKKKPIFVSHLFAKGKRMEKEQRRINRLFWFKLGFTITISSLLGVMLAYFIITNWLI